MGAAEQGLATALDLHRVGVDLMRQNLRRRHPDHDDDVIETLVGEWLRERPGAAHGDGQQPDRPS